MLKIKKNLRYSVPFFLLIFVLFTASCNKTQATNTDETSSTPTAVPTPEEKPESYQNDIDDYEPTDSLSQDSDGPVH